MGVDKQMTLMVVVMVHTLSKKKTLTSCEGFFMPMWLTLDYFMVIFTLNNINYVKN